MSGLFGVTVVLCVSLVCGLENGVATLEEQFASFCQTYGKTYSTIEEQQHRLGVFVEVF